MSEKVTQVDVQKLIALSGSIYSGRSKQSPQHLVFFYLYDVSPCFADTCKREVIRVGLDAKRTILTFFSGAVDSESWACIFGAFRSKMEALSCGSPAGCQGTQGTGFNEN
jgi:hypothetical protein